MQQPYELSHSFHSSPTLIFYVIRVLSPADLAYQESLIRERETEIQEIETGIHELNEIFRDLGTLVVEQGTMLGKAYSCESGTLHVCVAAWFLIRITSTDNIESNISSVAINTGQASEELTTAAEYQRKAGRRAACLMLVLVVVICVVLVAVSQMLILAFIWRDSEYRTMVARFQILSP